MIAARRRRWADCRALPPGASAQRSGAAARALGRTRSHRAAPRLLDTAPGGCVASAGSEHCGGARAGAAPAPLSPVPRPWLARRRRGALSDVVALMRAGGAPFRRVSSACAATAPDAASTAAAARERRPRVVAGRRRRVDAPPRPRHAPRPPGGRSCARCSTRCRCRCGGATAAAARRLQRRLCRGARYAARDGARRRAASWRPEAGRGKAPGWPARLPRRRPRPKRHHVVIGGSRRLLELTEPPDRDRRHDRLRASTAPISKAPRASWRATSTRTAEVLENIHAAVAIYGPDKRLNFFNSAFARLWGLEEDWLAGEPSLDEVAGAPARAPAHAGIRRFPRLQAAAARACSPR